MAGFCLDGTFDGLAKAILAVVMEIAFHVAQWLLRLSVQAGHAFGHVDCVTSGRYSTGVFHSVTAWSQSVISSFSKTPAYCFMSGVCTSPYLKNG